MLGSEFAGEGASEIVIWFFQNQKPGCSYDLRMELQSDSVELTPRLNAQRPIQRVVRWTLAALFVAAGAWHFIRPTFYRAIVPPGFGPPATIVAVSGAAEIAGGIGLMIPALRRPAAWGLVALLVAVFPANIYMLTGRDKIAGGNFPLWALWARLPLQGILIGLVLWAGGSGKTSSKS